MHSGSHSTANKALLASLGAGILLCCLPASATNQVRELARLLLLPGQKGALAVLERTRTAATSLLSSELQKQQAELASLKSELRESKTREQQALLIATNAQQQLADARRQPPQVQVTKGEPLFALRAIEAHVVGRELAGLWRAKRILDAGSKAGVQDEQWVVDGSSLAVDQGEVQNVAPGQMVFAGRTIVGRIAESGQHVSSVELITDRRFRAQAKIGRRSGNRIQFSSVGLLEGDGNGQCRMKLPDAAESVAVGDYVYSVPTETSFEAPMLFGEVIAAHQNSLQWEIVVKPAADPAQLRTVQVLTPVLNPERLIGRK